MNGMTVATLENRKTTCKCVSEIQKTPPSSSSSLPVWGNKWNRQQTWLRCFSRSLASKACNNYNNNNNNNISLSYRILCKKPPIRASKMKEDDNEIRRETKSNALSLVSWNAWWRMIEDADADGTTTTTFASAGSSAWVLFIFLPGQSVKPNLLDSLTCINIYWLIICWLTN